MSKPPRPPTIPPATAQGTPPPIPPAPLDPRRHVIRDGAAAVELQGKVQAARYLAGHVRQVIRAAVPLRRTPRPDASLDTELLFGEQVMVYETDRDWAWVQAVRDGYVGYVPADALTADVRAATHKVSAIGTFVYPAADIKAPATLHLSLGSELMVVESHGPLLKLNRDAGFVVARHLAEIARAAPDFVDVAERFIGVPYLWGGRTRLGLDCSGLVQIALQSAGRTCPRDSDMQQAEVGALVLVPADLEGLERGDLVCWPGHIGIMIDGVMLLHANAHHMAVVAEPLADAADRIARSGHAIAAVKRPGAARTG